MSWNNTGGTGKFKWRPRLGIYTDGTQNKFYPETCEATSYAWWTYVKKIKGKVVFNAYPYSPTTQNHQSACQDLLAKLGIKIDVTVYTRESLSKLDSLSGTTLTTLYREMFEIEVKGKRRRKQGTWITCLHKYFETREAATKELKSQIKLVRSLGAKLSRDDIRKLKLDVINDDTRDLERKRDEARELREERAKLAPTLNDLGPISILERELDNLSRVSGF